MTISNPAVISNAEMGEIFISGVGIVLGGAEMEQICSRAGLPALQAGDGSPHIQQVLACRDLASLQSSLQAAYGSRGSDGVMLHAGREFYKDFFRRYAIQLGFMEPAYRMQSTKKRISAGLKILAETITRQFSVPAEVRELADEWELAIFPPGNEADILRLVESGSWFFIGMLQEYLLWAAGGKVYQVKHNAPESAETGGRAIFSVSKKSLS